MNPLTIQQSSEIHSILSDAEDKIRELLGYRVFISLDAPEINPERKLSVIDIIDIVANRFELTPDQIRAKGKTKYPVPDARKISIGIICNKRKDLTYGRIGYYFSGMDHSTVMHSKGKYADLCETDPAFKQIADECIILVNKAEKKLLNNDI